VLAAITVPLLAGIGVAIARKGAGAVTLDLVILVFFVVGFALHRSPGAYARAFGAGAGEASGIVLQFPIYFGIVAVARDAGLVVKLAGAFADLAAALPLAAATTAPLITYFSACAVNFLVPSGGGQWVVQSPVILGLVQELGVERAPLVMAFAYGDQTTNLLQPFWALPLLSISGLRARDIMGYAMVALMVEVAIVVPCLIAFS
jgi:short-chain fatty acids transporter